MRANKKDLNHEKITSIISELRTKHNLPINFLDIHMTKKHAGDFVLLFGGDLEYDYAKKDSFHITTGITILCEVKRPRQSLNEKQVAEISKYPYGALYVIRCFDDVLRALQIEVFDKSYNKNYRKILKNIVETYYIQFLGKDPCLFYDGDWGV